MEGINEQVHAWYALRRTLPPWRFEESLAELVERLPLYGVDEVIVKVDTEEFSHGQPLLSWVEAYQPSLLCVRHELAKLGIVYSLNPWITVGHNDRGRDSRKQLPGLQTTVGHDGEECTCCACPVSEVWRENTARVWTLYAETRPHVMWVEDDIRTFNHQPVEFGCFCPLHMERFSERVGQTVTRRQLVEAILRPGRPHAWRAEFLDMQAEIMIETVRFLARTVHAVSPETRMGLMSSGPRVHCLEGRRWAAFAEALADDKPLYSRPPMGNYCESSMRGLYYSHDSIKITRHSMPQGTVEQTEVENFPFTQYSKSTAFTFVEMAVSFAYGSHGVTLNVYDHMGTPMERTPQVGRSLAEHKPFLEALAGRAARPGTYRGVRLLHADRAGALKHLAAGSQYPDLREDGAETMTMLESFGVPTTYAPSGVVATSGQQLRAFSDDEIGAMLSQGMLLDAVAARVLFDRGFGNAIGLASIEPPVCIDDLGAFSAEEFFNPLLGGAEKKFLSLTLPGLRGRPEFSLVEPVEGAQVISRVADPDAKRHDVCMVAYENDLGGRVVVHALKLDSAYGSAFNHPHRAEQIVGAVRWLARDRFALFVEGGVFPLVFRKDMGDETLLGLFNLTLDPWPFAQFELAEERAVDRTEVLSGSGRWEEDARLSCRAAGERLLVRYDGAVPYDAPLFVSVYWK
jgi:hypothetical protein